MSPSKGPLPDRRKNTELTDIEVQDQITKRDARLRRTKIQTISGIGLGVVGLLIAASAGLLTENIWMTIIGVVMALIGFGFTSPKEAADMVRGILGRNKGDS
jgi:hypothetical protein